MHLSNHLYLKTYLQHLQRDHPELDYSTAFWFARRYKFLNTHYLPQFHWVANLSQYLRGDTKIRLRNFQDFNKITDIRDRAYVVPPSSDFVKKIFEDNKDIELWLFLDQVLLDLAGQELTWNELVTHYQKHYPEVIKHVLP